MTGEGCISPRSRLPNRLSSHGDESTGTTGGATEALRAAEIALGDMDVRVEVVDGESVRLWRGVTSGGRPLAARAEEDAMGSVTMCGCARGV